MTAAKWQNRITRYGSESPDQLAANPRNWRTHPRSQTDALSGVLREVGVVQNVIVNERTGYVVDGHARISLALRDGQPSVPVTYVDLSEDEEALILATLDPLSAMAGADSAQLDALLRDVSSGDAAVQQMLSELAQQHDAITKFKTGDESDDFDPTPDNGPTRCQFGDLWMIDGGRHRLVIGDSTDAATVARLMGDDACETLIYDPPWDAQLPSVAPLASTIAFCDGRRLGDIVTRFGPPTWTFTWDCMSTWYSPNRPLQRAKYALWYGDVTTYQFEGAHYGDAGKIRSTGNARGNYTFIPDPRGKHLADVYVDSIRWLHADGEHPHEKPLDWIRMLIANCTTGKVYDPFLGSGTSIIAAHRNGRRCYGVEIEPRYGDVILRRCEAEGLRVEVSA